MIRIARAGLVLLWQLIVLAQGGAGGDKEFQAADESLEMASKHAHSNTVGLHSPPTTVELKESCPAEYAACAATQACRGLLSDPATTYSAVTPPKKRPAEFIALAQCFDQSSIGTVKQAAIADNRFRLQRASEDIKCELCTYVAEDLFSMMRQRPSDGAEIRNVASKANVAFHSDEDAVLTLVGNMCQEQGSLARWSGMYELAPCGGDLALSKHKTCRKGQGHFLVRSPGPRRASLLIL